ncbi:MAG: LytR family transcriptional regulator [Dorea sp.]|nr:LytR family transcriptional regulator [Dorea sp.]
MHERVGRTDRIGRPGGKNRPQRTEVEDPIRKNDIIRKVGFALAGIQAVISIVFLVALFRLNMFPGLFVAVIGFVLAACLGIILASQFFSKKNAISGKVLSVVISILLLIASYYLFRVNSAIGEISGGEYKLDNMVVAVMAEDSAEKIQDAKEYRFGVQYQMKGEQIKETVDAINEELGTEIEVVEYESLAEQAEALHNGEVEAIIYNEGYSGILEEAYEGYSSDTKIIFSHSIKNALENKAADVEVKDESFSVYISGIDVYGAIETNSRSDVNIIATVNPKTHQVLLVTTPRDYYVEIPGISGGQKDKLTHAGVYGVDASMATLEQLYDTEIDFYARVNFTSLIEMVDALGGVDVESEYAFTTSADSGLVMNVAEGTNHFNGKQALAFSRERQNVPGGDNQRGKDQQAVITAMIKKMVSPAILTGANGIISSVSGNVETNMSEEQIQNLIKQQLAEGGSWNIKSLAAEGTGDSQYCYSYTGMPLYVMQPDQTAVETIRAAINAVENGETLEGSIETE